jgi:uncharacterized metal-binding protein YceD (DUF177 family)
MSQPLSSAADEPRFVVDLAQLPPQGLSITGEVAASIFDLPESQDDLKPTSPLRYSLHLRRQEGLLHVSGRLEADFSLLCVRCVEMFRERIVLEPYVLEEEINENSLTVDLTESFRDDILLALPDYPHCDDSRLAARTCPATDAFVSSSQYQVMGSEEKKPPGAPDVWDTLDQLNLDPETK